MKLTDEELTRLAATGIMGWSIENCFSGEYYNNPSSDIEHPWVRNWKPLTDWRAAGEIAERMRESSGWWCRITSPFDSDSPEWNAGFCPESTTGWNGRMDHKYQAASGPRAITIAALLAVKAITEDQV